MFKFSIKEKLLDRSDRTATRGLAWILILLILLLMSAAVLYFSQNVRYQGTAASTSLTTNRPPRQYSIFYDRGVFSPTNLRIHAGDAVKFQNTSPTSILVISDPHPAHNNLPALNSGGELAPKGGYFIFTFRSPGIFNYHNEKDPNEIGTIIVR